MTEPNPVAVKIAIAWRQLPLYGTRLIQSVMGESTLSVAVLSSGGRRAEAEPQEVESSKLHYPSGGGKCSWSGMDLPIPDVFFYSGWDDPALKALASQVRSAGGKTVLMMDNNRSHNLRQAMGKWIFRYAVRSKVNQYFVPGREARNLLSYYGVGDEIVKCGLYGGDSSLFQPGGNRSSRKRDFLFVGQLIRRKGLYDLVKAILELRSRGNNPTLLCVGEGPLRSLLEDAGICTMPFLKPNEIAGLMAESRFLVLPSLEEHWGVVVHEATLCGCGLILSDRVGSKSDLLTETNGFQFPAGDWRMLSEVLGTAGRTSDEWFGRCSQESLRVSSQFGPEVWKRQFQLTVEQLRSVG